MMPSCASYTRGAGALPKASPPSGHVIIHARIKLVGYQTGISVLNDLRLRIYNKPSFIPGVSGKEYGLDALYVRPLVDGDNGEYLQAVECYLRVPESEVRGGFGRMEIQAQMDMNGDEQYLIPDSNPVMESAWRWSEQSFFQYSLGEHRTNHTRTHRPTKRVLSMPIIKTGPRITHMYRQLRSGQPPAFDNDDLSVIGDTPSTRITENIHMKDAQIKPWHSRYQDGKVAFGYRPFGITVFGSGFIATIAGIVFLVSAIAHFSSSEFGKAFPLISFGVLMMWYGGFAPYRRFIIFDRANGLVHVSSRLWRRRYLSLRWQDVSFVNGHWLLPDPYKLKPLPTYDITLVMPPSTLDSMGVVSYKLQGQVLYGASNLTKGMTNTTLRCTSSDPTWRFIVLFMCHGPCHHPVMQRYIDLNERIRNEIHGGDWLAMLNDDMHSLPFWGRQMKRFRVPELSDTPTHVIGDDGKWRKLKQNERAAHRTGPRWEHIKPEHAAILR